jgi:hypothetical protein
VGSRPAPGHSLGAELGRRERSVTAVSQSKADIDVARSSLHDADEFSENYH